MIEFGKKNDAMLKNYILQDLVAPAGNPTNASIVGYNIIDMDLPAVNNLLTGLSNFYC